MIKKIKYMGLLSVALLFVGCVPVVQPALQPQIGQEMGSIGIGEVLPPVSEYGIKPKNYVSAIKNYFSVKLTRGDKAQYKFSNPKRAYKRKGLAYGGGVAWRGWLVETSVATPNRAGRVLTPKPYMVLFSGEQIVEHILGSTHKLVVKVDK